MLSLFYDWTCVGWDGRDNMVVLERCGGAAMIFLFVGGVVVPLVVTPLLGWGTIIPWPRGTFCFVLSLQFSDARISFSKSQVHFLDPRIFIF